MMFIFEFCLGLLIIAITILVLVFIVGQVLYMLDEIKEFFE